MPLLDAPVMHVDGTAARVNGNNNNADVCSNGAATMYFARENKGHAGMKDNKKVKLSIATLTTLLLGYKTATKLYWMGRIEADRETIQLLDDIILHEMPYISDYI